MDIGFKGNILGDFEAAGGFVKIVGKQYNHLSVGKYEIYTRSVTFISLQWMVKI